MPFLKGITAWLAHHIFEPITLPSAVNMYGILADLLVAVHVAYVAYVVFGQLAIWTGWAFGRQFVRNFWFRSTHLLAIGIVAFEEVFEIRCPLSVWEEQLRVLAGQDISGETFMGRLMHSLIFHDFPRWVFSATHLTVFALVLLTIFLCPPRRPFRRKDGTAKSPYPVPQGV
jgi:hypothetical protein